MNKLPETVMLSLAAAFFGIAVHQTMNFGFAQSYFIYMLSAAFFLAYVWLRGRTLRKQASQKAVNEISKVLKEQGAKGKALPSRSKPKRK